MRNENSSLINKDSFRLSPPIRFLRAATAYDGDEDDDLTTTDDENDNGDEEGDEAERDGGVTGKESDSSARDGGGASGMGAGGVEYWVIKSTR